MKIKITRVRMVKGERYVDFTVDDGDSTGWSLWPDGVSEEEHLADLKAKLEMGREDAERRAKLMREAEEEYDAMSAEERKRVHAEVREYMRRGIYPRDEWRKAAIAANMHLKQGVSNLFMKMSHPCHPNLEEELLDELEAEAEKAIAEAARKDKKKP